MTNVTEEFETVTEISVKKIWRSCIAHFSSRKKKTKFFWTKKGPKTNQKKFQRQDLPMSTAKELKVAKTRKKRIKFAYPVERKNAKLKKLQFTSKKI